MYHGSYFGISTRPISTDSVEAIPNKEKKKKKEEEGMRAGAGVCVDG
jgi:hypothetical protein